VLNTTLWAEPKMSTRIATTWQTIYDLVGAIDYTHPQGAGYKYVYGAFPDKTIEDSTIYPLIIVHNPEFSQTEQTYNAISNKVSIDIEVYTTNAALIDSLSDKIITKIEHSTSRNTLASSNLYTPEITSMMSSTYRKGAMKIHLLRMRYSFRMVYVR